MSGTSVIVYSRMEYTCAELEVRRLRNSCSTGSGIACKLDELLLLLFNNSPSVHFGANTNVPHSWRSTKEFDGASTVLIGKQLCCESL